MSGEHLHNYANWLINKRVNYSSRSTCWMVKELYDEILEHEFTDTDYWYSPGGDELNRKLATFFPYDWEQLKEDIPNWKSNQLEILAIILTRNDAFSSMTETDLQLFQSRKSEIYTLILGICGDDIFIDLIGDLHFIKLSAHKDLNLLTSIHARLLKLESSPLIESGHSSGYFHTRKTYESFLETLREEMEKATP